MKRIKFDATTVFMIIVVIAIRALILLIPEDAKPQSTLFPASASVIDSIIVDSFKVDTAWDWHLITCDTLQRRPYGKILSDYAQIPVIRDPETVKVDSILHWQNDTLMRFYGSYTDFVIHCDTLFIRQLKMYYYDHYPIAPTLEEYPAWINQWLRGHKKDVYYHRMEAK